MTIRLRRIGDIFTTEIAEIHRNKILNLIKAGLGKKSIVVSFYFTNGRVGVISYKKIADNE
jgi:hypothetical protein